MKGRAKRIIVIAVGTAAVALTGAPAALAVPGGLDPGFSGDGLQAFVPGPDVDATLDGVAAQPDGKVVVAGLRTVDDSSALGFHDEGQVARYTSDGSLDPLFGDGGVAPIDIGGTRDCLPVADWLCPAKVAVEPDGRIVVAIAGVHEPGEAGHGLPTLVERLLPDGIPDPGFGTDGVRIVERFFAEDMALAPGGDVLLGGFARRSRGGVPAVRRLLPSGADDRSFGDGGLATTGNGRYLLRGVAVQPNGAVVTAGEKCATGSRCGSGDELAATRLRRSGKADRSFGRDGIASVHLWGRVRAAGANAVTIDAAGRVALAGYARTPGQVKLAIARLRRDGRVDRSFASRGTVAAGFGAPDAGGLDGIAGARSIVAAGNELYAAGGVGREFVSGAIAVVAYTGGHGIDREFGSEGQVRTVPAAGAGWGCAAGEAAALAPGHRLVVSGYQYGCDEEEGGYEGPPDAGVIAVYER